MSGDRDDRAKGGERADWTSMRWALRPRNEPAMTAADWLAEDLVPGCAGAVALLTDPLTPIADLRRAKDGFKAMRLLGEQPADRRLGARLYLAAIAAGLAYHGERISAQSDGALIEALTQMRDDAEVVEELRSLALAALRRLEGSDRPRRPPGAGAR